MLRASQLLKAEGATLTPTWYNVGIPAYGPAPYFASALRTACKSHRYCSPLHAASMGLIEGLIWVKAVQILVLLLFMQNCKMGLPYRRATGVCASETGNLKSSCCAQRARADRAQTGQGAVC